mmetsp:Transcript_65444/g.116106  ORF Transcript_65444/g.116106 Transcript_65444/m.116106 type:complete len:237 (+) Transcript_65444:267-977(+)
MKTWRNRWPTAFHLTSWLPRSKSFHLQTKPACWSSVTAQRFLGWMWALSRNSSLQNSGQMVFLDLPLQAIRQRRTRYSAQQLLASTTTVSQTPSTRGMVAQRQARFVLLPWQTFRPGRRSVCATCQQISSRTLRKKDRLGPRRPSAFSADVLVAKGTVQKSSKSTGWKWRSCEQRSGQSCQIFLQLHQTCLEEACELPRSYLSSAEPMVTPALLECASWAGKATISALRASCQRRK